ncbi:MAG: 50S ribosomal protein L11 methyltransferase [Deltaproteobacteria bacterium]|nr:50S ribosomal protein L11 methyltransferase [Deltaproteobacteria bacterium]
MDTPSTPQDFYWELQVEIAPEAEELWSLYCFEMGATGAETLNDEGTLHRLRYFFNDPPAGTPDTWKQDFASRFPRHPVPASLLLSRHANQPWETAWQVHFEPLAVGDTLLICPPWRPQGSPEWPGRLPVVIHPGQGFGTGRHASTALALRMVEQVVRNTSPVPQTVLDMGAGSGVLALAACRLGVPRATLADIDPVVLPEIQENFRLNALPAPLALIQGGPREVQGQFDLVVANILAPVLMEYAVELTGLTARAGSLILSGILGEEAPAVLSRFASLGWQPSREVRMEAWYACTLRHEPIVL